MHFDTIISNRKAAGGEDIPIELLKAGGDEEALRVLTTTVCAIVYGRRRNGRPIGTNQCMSRFTRKETRSNVEITSQLP